MKQLIFLLLFCPFTHTFSQKSDYFHTIFDKNAVQRNDANAYLLGYVSYLAYPKYLYNYMHQSQPDLPQEVQNKMDRDKDFYLSQFRENTKVFWRDLPVENYAIFALPNSKKYDPEAVLVEDDSTIWVIFRGTDSVMTRKNDFLRVYAEWFITDFDFKLVENPRYSSGKIHHGFSKSLDGIADVLANEVIKRQGRYKKIWICGHSLGAAQAILFAYFLQKKYQISVQGIYAYACPLIGDAKFAQEADSLFAARPIQRFEFVHDPVTMIPAPFLGYEHVGIRNYFDDFSQVKYAIAERKRAEGNSKMLEFPIDISVKFLDDIVYAFTQPLYINLQIGGLCYHHPEWYVQALYRPEIQNQFPNLLPMPLPTIDYEDCNCYRVARAKSQNVKVRNQLSRKFLKERLRKNLQALEFL